MAGKKLRENANSGIHGIKMCFRFHRLILMFGVLAHDGVMLLGVWGWHQHTDVPPNQSLWQRSFVLAITSLLLNSIQTITPPPHKKK